MKRLLTYISAVLMISLSSFALLENTDEIVDALQKGDATELSRFFDDNVQLSMPSKTDSYSKAQARIIIKDFFSLNEVKGFELKNKGNAPGGVYLLGIMQTGSTSFRVHVFIKQVNGKDLIHELRFQPLE